MHGNDEERHNFEAEEYEQRWCLNWGLQWKTHRYGLGIPLDVALVESGKPRSVALVGCGKRKFATEAGVPAHQLYIGNPFRMSYAHAKETADDVLILSALHGLVEPTHRLAPYDYTMTQMLMSEQREWGINVVRALKVAYPLTPLRIIFYAGGHYVRPVVDALQPELGYWDYIDPLQGLDLFQRLAWFKAQRTS